MKVVSKSGDHFVQFDNGDEFTTLTVQSSLEVFLDFGEVTVPKVCENHRLAKHLLDLGAVKPDGWGGFVRGNKCLEVYDQIAFEGGELASIEFEQWKAERKRIKRWKRNHKSKT